MLKHLDFKEFLSHPKNRVFICFNATTVKDLFSVTDEEVPLYLYYWHFIRYEEEFKSYRLLKFSQEAVFTYGDEKIDIGRVHNILRQFEKRWKEKFSQPFPDVAISRIDGSGSYSQGSPGQISLTVKELQDPSLLEFVLGHELGHHFYFNNIQSAEESKLKNISYLKSHGVPWMFLVLVLWSLGSVIHLSLTAETWLVVAFAFLQTMVISFMGYFELGSWMSFDRRIKNYSQEFYADHFAQKFLERIVDERDHRFVGQVVDFNVFSHPNFNARMRSLEANVDSTFYAWENPVIKQPKRFTRSSYYEISVFWPMKIKELVDKVKRSFWGYFPNKAKKNP